MNPRTTTISGLRFLITPTDKTATRTGRRRYRVFCRTCAAEVHPATTGPESWAESHVRNNHPSRVDGYGDILR